MAWYRQYRPRKIEELNIVVVRQALQQMMSAGKIPQTLLFAGPKGTGKTSTSRIIGAILNDPQNEDLVEELYFKGKKAKKSSFVEADTASDFAERVYQGNSFVVQELDAASNRRIDDIRQLKDRINLPPQDGKMTVYILDEVHMLTNEAFNALLKILEEPPAHVVFILATTELHKIPETIKSRCSIVRFQKASEEEISEALRRVLDAEKIKYQAEDLLLIARRADGSFRDAVKILEQACQSGELDLKVIESILASNNQSLIIKVIKSVINKDEISLINVFEELRASNANQKDFYKDFFDFLHQQLLINLAVKSGKAEFSQKIVQFFLKELTQADLSQETPIPFLVLELKLLEIIDRSKKTGGGGTTPKKNDPGSKDKNNSQEKTATAVKKNESFTKNEVKSNFSEEKDVFKEDLTTDKIVNSQPIKEETKTIISDLSFENLEKVEDQNQLWSKMINFLKNDNFSLATLLKSCKLDCIENTTAKVLVYYSFHKEQLEQNKNTDLLEKLLAELWGSPLKLEFVLNSDFEKSNYNQEEDLVGMAKDLLI